MEEYELIPHPPTTDGHLKLCHPRSLFPIPVSAERQAICLQSSKRLTLILGCVQNGPRFRVRETVDKASQGKQRSEVRP